MQEGSTSKRDSPLVQASHYRMAKTFRIGRVAQRNVRYSFSLTRDIYRLNGATCMLPVHIAARKKMPNANLHWLKIREQSLLRPMRGSSHQPRSSRKLLLGSLSSAINLTSLCTTLKGEGGGIKIVILMTNPTELKRCVFEHTD